jgi:predicted deacylase
MKWTRHKLELSGQFEMLSFSLDTGLPGPTLVLVGGVHGDEYTGVESIHQLMETLPLELACGRVVCYPSLNPAGAELAQRSLPGDGGDLNRSFPGRVLGSLSSRLAHGIWENIVEWSPDLVLDIHADSFRSVPYVIVDRPVLLAEAEKATCLTGLVAAARSLGCVVLLEYEAKDYQRYGLQHSLAGSLVNFGNISALTLEVGGRNAVDQTVVNQAKKSVKSLLGYFGMIEAAGSSVAPDKRLWLRSMMPPTRSEGIIVPLLEAGTPFEKGEVIAHVRHHDGRIADQLRVPWDGLVITWRDIGWVKAGSVVGTLGRVVD